MLKTRTLVGVLLGFIVFMIFLELIALFTDISSLMESYSNTSIDDMLSWQIVGLVGSRMSYFIICSTGILLGTLYFIKGISSKYIASIGIMYSIINIVDRIFARLQRFVASISDINIIYSDGFILSITVVLIVISSVIIGVISVMLLVNDEN